MKKIYLSALTILGLGLVGQLHAQCDNERYQSFLFPNAPVVTADVVYGNNIKQDNTPQVLKLDVYEPNGDFIDVRPLVIVAHGGSFLGGSKTGADVVPICKDLAKLGYVAASIEYRVGMGGFPFPGPDSSDATEAVMRAVQDGRAAVRYFRKNATIGGNTFKVDTNNIFFAGVSAGGFIALQMAYLDEVSEIPTYIDLVGQPGLGGGLQGNSGNLGYSSEVKAIINMCGALGDTTWMKTGDEPVLNFHGTNDGTVPYGTNMITLLGIYPLLKVNGGYSVNAQAVNLGIPSCFEIYEGQDHVPAVSNAAYYDTTIVKIRTFLKHFVCNDPLDCSYTGHITNAPTAGINNVNNNILHISPNPANKQLRIAMKNLSNKASISVINTMGQIALQETALSADVTTLDISSLPTGIYFVVINNDGQIAQQKFIKE